MEEQPTIQIDPFKKKESRADLQYVPKCKDLKDVVYTGDLSDKEDRDLLASIVEHYGKYH